MTIAFLGFLVFCGVGQAADEPLARLEPIQKVEIGQNAEFIVNGKPFFPLASWLQSTGRYPKLRELGINVFVGNHNNTPPADEMASLAMKAGAYAMPLFNGVGAGNPGIFGWILDDEPDLTSKVSDAVVTPAKGLRINPAAPLSAMLDGNPKSGSVIDPMAEAAFTFELKAPVTIKSLAVSLPAVKDDANAQPTELTFLIDGKEILKTPVETKVGQQRFDLPQPATFQKLEVQVSTAKAGKLAWGLINEIEGFDADGKNVLKSEPYGRVHQLPEETLAKYNRIKAADPGKPVWLTVTARFLPRYEGWHKVPLETIRPMYAKWAQANDAFGTDIYPIYGFNKPEWLLDNIVALKKMRELAGPNRPLYIWIETGNGGQQQSPTSKVEPKHTRAEVWMSIIAGARGIGYFTHAWKPTFSEFNCDEPMQAELKRLNTQITRLAPAICAAPAKAKTEIAFDNGISGHLMANDAEGGLFIVAQNLDLSGKSAKAKITVEGLRAGTKVEVVDENRTIVAAEGSFEDTFDALAEHVYRVTP
jgi:hypothetical protein